MKKNYTIKKIFCFQLFALIFMSQSICFTKTVFSNEPSTIVTIVLPYKDATASQVVFWANEEKDIDFRKDPVLAGRCTASFTATELAYFLEHTLSQMVVAYAESEPEHGFFIKLAIKDPASRECSFSIEPVANGIVITGDGRTGLLYGGYEFLRMQGWRWFAPGDEGQIAPTKKKQLFLPEKKSLFKPTFDLGRGFHFADRPDQESTDFWIWMARNRMNLVGYRQATGDLQKKLGMIFIDGGHIFEKVLDPDRIMPSGKILWDEHRDWYGLPKNGKKIKSHALSTQFCVSQPDLMEFLGEELLGMLMKDWNEADLVNVWGFDVFGSTCSCEECKQLGNGTDQALHFLSALRDYLNVARIDKRLDHDVRMIICAYDGTNTLEGPQNPFPKNLIDSDDKAVFYPIDRCYVHDFYDETCKKNNQYRKYLDSWFSQSPSMDIYIGEYYNVSKYEDLPVLFTDRMRQDIPYYHKAGCKGITYMHVPLVNWGPRTLTQTLYAQLAWDVTTNVDAFLDEYYAKWYGSFAPQMREAYKKNEEAWRYISQWRNWHHTILRQLMGWDGKTPKKELIFSENLLSGHFDNAKEAIRSGRHSIKLLAEVLTIVDKVREIAIIEQPYDLRISEDYRLLRYGLHTMELMVNMLAYYEALRSNIPDQGNKEWDNIQRVAKEMDSYWVPIKYAKIGKAGIVSEDALTRTQLKELFQRCKQYRIDNNMQN